MLSDLRAGGPTAQISAYQWTSRPPWSPQPGSYERLRKLGSWGEGLGGLGDSQGDSWEVKGGGTKGLIISPLLSTTKGMTRKWQQRLCCRRSRSRIRARRGIEPETRRPRRRADPLSSHAQSASAGARCLNVTCVQCENGKSISPIDSAQPTIAHDANTDSDLARPPCDNHPKEITTLLQILRRMNLAKWR